MTEKQLEIYKGLQALGPEISSFYKDGIEIIQSDLSSKSYLLAHLLREIDGGLRGLFVSTTSNAKINKAELTNLYEELYEEYQDFEYLQNIEKKDVKAPGHIKSIVGAFGLDLKDPNCKKYIKNTIILNKYAHRHGPYKMPRNPQDIVNIWQEFEEILAQLIGNYYSISKRIDQILREKVPNEEHLNTLPHLLKNISRRVYFFNNLTSPSWLEPLKRRGYFDGKNNLEPYEDTETPGFIFTPYWPALKYLRKISEGGNNQLDISTHQVLSQVIDGIAFYKKPNGRRIVNSKTDYNVFELICNLPVGFLKERHLEFIRELVLIEQNDLVLFKYTKLLDRLLLEKSGKLILIGLEILLSYKEIEERPLNRFSSIFPSFELKRILGKKKGDLINSFGQEVMDLSLQKVLELSEKNPLFFSDLYIPAIEDHSQTRFPDKLNCQLVYLIRDSLEVLPYEITLEKLIKFIKHPNSILRRIAIHVICKRFKEFENLVWESKVNPLCDPYIKHEFYELIKEHCRNFKNEKIDQFISWIYSIENCNPGNVESSTEIWAYKKKEWLTALLGLGSPKIENLIEELNSISDSPITHPGFSSWSYGIVGLVSPLTTDQISGMDISEIVLYFDRFIPNEDNHLEPSVDGFLDNFYEAVKRNPQNFNLGCTILIESSTEIQYYWLKGLSKAWHDSQINFDVTEILETLSEIIRSDFYWQDYNILNKENRYKSYLISELLWFLEYGIRNDAHAFPPNMLPTIKEILVEIYERIEPIENFEFDIEKIQTEILNKSKGKIYVVLLQYSLRLARVQKKEINRWDNSVKNIFDQKIELKIESPFLFFAVGQFLPQIHYLDESWIKMKFKDIFDPAINKNWISAISGFFLYNRNNLTYCQMALDEDIYDLALESNVLSKQVLNAVTENICFSYSEDIENMGIDSPIFEKIFNSKKKEIFQTLINFFWSPDRPIYSKYREKIKPLWKRIYLECSPLNEPVVDKYILANSTLWIKNIPHLGLDGDIYEWVIKSIPYLDIRTKSVLIEDFINHIHESPREIGNLLLELCRTGTQYYLRDNTIIEQVTLLYENGEKEIADKICLIHGEEGDHKLRSLYESNNLII